MDPSPIPQLVKNQQIERLGFICAGNLAKNMIELITLS